ncbi:hypothetical protein KNE206_53090 [Kitasatospora sp. NE20-6]
MGSGKILHSFGEADADAAGRGGGLDDDRVPDAPDSGAGLVEGAGTDTGSGGHVEDVEGNLTGSLVHASVSGSGGVAEGAEAGSGMGGDVLGELVPCQAPAMQWPRARISAAARLASGSLVSTISYLARWGSCQVGSSGVSRTTRCRVAIYSNA